MPPTNIFEVSLLRAFDGMKQMAVPSADKKPNVFELRNYISSSENKGLNKIKMFESGEIDVMKQVGLAPIFYSRMVVGSQMPSLVYMTSGENLEASTRNIGRASPAPKCGKICRPTRNTKTTSRRSSKLFSSARLLRRSEPERAITFAPPPKPRAKSPKRNNPPTSPIHPRPNSSVCDKRRAVKSLRAKNRRSIPCR